MDKEFLRSCLEEIKSNHGTNKTWNGNFEIAKQLWCFLEDNLPDFLNNKLSSIEKIKAKDATLWDKAITVELPLSSKFISGYEKSQRTMLNEIRCNKLIQYDTLHALAKTEFSPDNFFNDENSMKLGYDRRQHTLFNEYRTDYDKKEGFEAGVTRGVDDIIEEIKTYIKKYKDATPICQPDFKNEANSNEQKAVLTPQNKVKASKADRIRELFYQEDKLSYSQIANRVGTTSNYVKKVMNKR